MKKFAGIFRRKKKKRAGEESDSNAETASTAATASFRSPGSSMASPLPPGSKQKKSRWGFKAKSSSKSGPRTSGASGMISPPTSRGAGRGLASPEDRQQRGSKRATPKGQAPPSPTSAAPLSPVAISRTQSSQSVRSVPGVEVLDLQEFLDESDHAAARDRRASGVSFAELVGRKQASSTAAATTPATIEQIDEIFKHEENFGKYLKLVNASDQQEVLFICEIDQLLERCGSLKTEEVAAQEQRIGVMYLNRTGSGHYQIQSIRQDLRKRLQKSIDDTKNTDVEAWRAAQLEAKRNLCKESVPKFLEFVNKQRKEVADSAEDYKYLYSIQDVFRNANLLCAFLLFMLRDRRHRMLLFWMDLSKERIKDLILSLEHGRSPGSAVSSPTLPMPQKTPGLSTINDRKSVRASFAPPEQLESAEQLGEDVCLRLEAIYRKYIPHEEPGLPMKLDRNKYTLGDLLDARAAGTAAALQSPSRGRRPPAEVWVQDMGKRYANMLYKMFKKMDKIIRLQCWSQFVKSQLYKDTVESVFDKDGAKARAIAKATRKKLKEYAHVNNIHVSFCNDAVEHTPQPSSSRTFLLPHRPVLEYVAVISRDYRPDIPCNARYVRRWPLLDRKGVPLPGAGHLEGLCMGRAPGFASLLLRSDQLGKDERLITENITTTVHVPVPNGDGMSCASLPWGFDSGLLGLLSGLVQPPAPRGEQGGRTSRPFPMVTEPKLTTFILTLMGGKHLYAASLCFTFKCVDAKGRAENSRGETPVLNGVVAEDGSAMRSFAVCTLSSRPVYSFLKDAIYPFLGLVRSEMDNPRGGSEMAEPYGSCLRRVCESEELARLVAMTKTTPESLRAQSIGPPPIDAKKDAEKDAKEDAEKDTKKDTKKDAEKDTRKDAEKDAEKESDQKGAKTTPNSSNESSDAKGSNDGKFPNQKPPSKKRSPPSNGPVKVSKPDGRIAYDLTTYIHTPDFSLITLFRCLQPKRAMLTLEYMLMEQKIIFLSSQDSILTEVVAAFQYLLYPFAWDYMLVPVLVPSMFQYVECPTPYIIGVNSAYRSRILTIESVQADALVVDLDNDQVYLQSNQNGGGKQLPARIPIPYATRILTAIDRLYRPGIFAADFPTAGDPRFSGDESRFSIRVDMVSAAAELRIEMTKMWAHLLVGFRRFCCRWPESKDPGCLLDCANFLTTKPRFAVHFLEELFKTLAFGNFVKARASAQASSGLKPAGNGLFDVLEAACALHGHESTHSVHVDIHVISPTGFGSLVKRHGEFAKPCAPDVSGQPAFQEPCVVGKGQTKQKKTKPDKEGPELDKEGPELKNTKPLELSRRSSQMSAFQTEDGELSENEPSELKDLMSYYEMPSGGALTASARSVRVSDQGDVEGLIQGVTAPPAKNAEAKRDQQQQSGERNDGIDKSIIDSQTREEDGFGTASPAGPARGLLRAGGARSTENVESKNSAVGDGKQASMAGEGSV